MPPIPAPRGRPSKYDPFTTPAAAEAWAKRGLTLKELAHRLGVDRATLVRWKARHPELDVAVRAGWEEAADHLVETLYRQALGFEYVDTRVTSTRRGVTVTRTRKFRSPHFRAVALWLSKQRPDPWGAAAAPEKVSRNVY